MEEEKEENKDGNRYKSIIWVLFGALIVISIILGLTLYTLNNFEKVANERIGDCNSKIKEAAKSCSPSINRAPVFIGDFYNESVWAKQNGTNDS